ncbi:hypothetical protein [Phenylobacterium sp.]|jgi:hypothetical protein|uniref:hypothetical protein n=1 Tax=Phenylobacterium sp. TaxID=1871053 RepID=UPI002F3FAB6D
MRLKPVILAAVFTAAASATLAAEPAASSAAAQARVRATLAADVGPMPADAAALDGYVAREDWTPLIKRLASTTAPGDMLLDLDWERSKVVNGGNLLFDIAYVNSVWKVASSLRGPVADQMRQTAVAFALYELAVVDLDGLRCKDPTAPAQKRALAVKNWPVIFRYGQSLPPQAQQVVEQVAVKLEWATAPVRANDPVLCRGGVAEMQANLAAGAKPQEVPTTRAPNDLPGKAYEIPHIVDYKPQYLAETVWKPRAEAGRARLPEAFAALLKAPPAAAPPPAPVK